MVRVYEATHRGRTGASGCHHRTESPPLATVVRGEKETALPRLGHRLPYCRSAQCLRAESQNCCGPGVDCGGTRRLEHKRDEGAGKRAVSITRSQSNGLRIFFSAGEPSGDLHAAALVQELTRQHPGVRALGYGGPHMRSAGCHLHEDLTELAVMWFARALIHLPRFLGLVSRADRFFRHRRPDAVVLVDYPGFNFWIARRAKVHGIPVFYYLPPQVWGWAGWRIKKMRRLVDHVLCALPFEAEFYRGQGCRSMLAGHPFFDHSIGHRPDRQFLQRLQQRGPLVTILPGSRNQELAANLQCQLKAAVRIGRSVPQTRFAVAAYKPQHAQVARHLLQQAGLQAEVYVGKTQELIQAAHCCLSVSGSVSLELLYHQKPTVILYRITRTAYYVQDVMRQVKYITLVNLLAARQIFRPGSRFAPPADGDAHTTGTQPSQFHTDAQVSDPLPGALAAVTGSDDPPPEKALFPEYLTWRDVSAPMADWIVRWLTNPAEYRARVAALGEVKSQIARPGASRRAAEYILQCLGKQRVAIPPPHFAAGRRAADQAAPAASAKTTVR